MSKIDSSKVDFKIAQPDSLYLIGSNSIETAGDLYVMNVNAISKVGNVRNKRSFDLILSGLFLVLSPLLIFAFKNKKQFIKNCWSVLIGRKSLVGYHFNQQENTSPLPKLKPGLLYPLESLSDQDPLMLDKINLIYARDYSIQKDFSILLKSWKKLDR